MTRQLRLNTMPVILHHFTTMGECDRWRRDHEDDEPSPEALGAVWITQDSASGWSHCLIYINSLGLQTAEPGELEKTLVHESVHAGCQILDEIGQAYDGLTEVLPYLVEAIHAWLKEGHAS